MRQLERLARWIPAVLITVAPSCSPATPQPAATAVASASATPNPNLGCKTIETSPTPSTASLLPPITADDFATGPVDAPVTMVLYCDLQSAQCEIFNRVLDELMENRPRDLRVVYRLFPVPVSAVSSLDKSESSARAAIAAGRHGKFWEMRQLLHQRYGDWATLSPGEFESWLLTSVEELDLEPESYEADLHSPETAEAASQAYEAAIGLGISSIPTVFTNGRLQDRAALSFSGLDSTIGLVSLAARQFRTCPPFEIDPMREYVATLETSKGDIVIQLFADRAPLAVNSFVFLSRNGWYDGSTFHRVVPGFVAQGGDPSGTGYGGPGYYFENEVYLDLRFDKPGVVGMANAGPDTNGSQFFITYAPQPQMDGGYTVFGQVLEGMDVVESLAPRDPMISPALPPGDEIISVAIETR